MNEIACRVSPSVVRDMRGHLDAVIGPYLSRDVSNYAPGRTRAWLQWEGPLSQRQSYRPGLRNARLWDWLCECWRNAGYPGLPDLGLALHGAIGIKPHRDASYANAQALTVNLGTADWGWHPERNGQDANGLHWQTIEPGDVLKFDCKHKHASRRLDPDRWAIVLWTAKRAVPTQR